MDVTFLIIGFLVAAGASIALLYMVTRRRKPPEPIKQPPVRPALLTGPDIDATKAGITDALAQIDAKTMELIDRRATIWQQSQDEIDRLTREIHNSQLVSDSYTITLKALERDKLGTFVDSLTVGFPDDFVDTDELEKALTVDGTIGGELKIAVD